MGADRFRAVKGITNKEAIKYLRDKAHTGPSFLCQGQTPFEIEGTTGARVYTLGPPHDDDLLLSLDPIGDESDDYANLSWLGRGEFAKDFMAMIPVHSDWANEERNWYHLLLSIDHALMKKARGRVYALTSPALSGPTARPTFLA